jgi:hypothetical protein
MTRSTGVARRRGRPARGTNAVEGDAMARRRRRSVSAVTARPRAAYPTLLRGNWAGEKVRLGQ